MFFSFEKGTNKYHMDKVTASFEKFKNFHLHYLSTHKRLVLLALIDNLYCFSIYLNFWHMPDYKR